MGDLTFSTTKPMLKIKGKPILEYKIRALPEKVKEVVFVVGYYAEHVIKYFGQYFNGRKITYVFQHHINGTGGALHVAKSILRNKFLVMMGDDLYHKKDLEKMLKHDLAILGYEAADPSRAGVIKTDERGNMTDVIENPTGREYKLANTGVYVLDKNFFNYKLIPKKEGDAEFGLPQTMAIMAKDYEIKVERARVWHPIGNQEDLKKAEKILERFL